MLSQIFTSISIIYIYCLYLFIIYIHYLYLLSIVFNYYKKRSGKIKPSKQSNEIEITERLADKKPIEIVHFKQF